MMRDKKLEAWIAGQGHKLGMPIAVCLWGGRTFNPGARTIPKVVITARSRSGLSGLFNPTIDGLVKGCAYFEYSDETLDVTQRKVDYVLRKYQLSPDRGRWISVVCYTYDFQHDPLSIYQKWERTHEAVSP